MQAKLPKKLKMTYTLPFYRGLFIMFEINPIKNKIADLSERTSCFGGIFDFDAKVERLERS